MRRGLARLGGAIVAALLGVGAPGCPRQQVDPPPTDAEVDGDGDADAAPDADEDSPPPCDPISGSGCEGGEVCATAIEGGGVPVVRCLPEGGTASPGEPCRFSSEDGLTATHDCPVGHGCVVASANGVARCLRLCTDDDPGACTGAYAGVEGVLPDGLCLFGLGDSPGLEGARLCLPVHDCDPRCDDCPSPYDTCFYLADALRSGWICYGTVFGDVGAGRVGDPCRYVNNCRQGTVCTPVGTSGERECRPYCDTRPETTLDPSCPRVRCAEGEGSCVASPDPIVRWQRPGLGVCLEE